jgi:HEAT repeat protein
LEDWIAGGDMTPKMGQRWPIGLPMKNKVSQSTERLIESLYARKGLWDRFVQSSAPDEVIQQITEAGELAVIPDLLPILIIGDRKAISASANAIHRLLQQLKPADFVQFDEFVRQGYSEWRVRREPWYTMKAEDIGHLASFGETSISILGIASFHTNGYVREAAVRELGKMQTGAELPFLFVRVNDWVPQVRSVARDLLLKRIRPEYIHHLIAWLPLALRLAKMSRDDHSIIVETVRALLSSPGAREALHEEFESKDLFVRRFCFELAMNSNETDCLSVLQTAFGQSDPEVRKVAVRKLRCITPNNASKRMLLQAIGNSSAPVRREALLIFAEEYPDEASQQFQFALLDTNVVVREAAQYYFQKKSNLDLRVFYSGALQNSSLPHLCAAIAGLGETGLPKDSRLLERFIADQSSRVRATALHAIAKLNFDAYFEEFVLALNDASSKVTGEALRALCKKPNLVGGQRLWEIYDRCSHPHGKRGALFLLARINKWDSIAFLVQSLAHQDDPFVDLSQKYISRWFSRYNRSFATPTAEQISRLRNVLSKCSLLLSSGTQRHLDSLLKSF